MCEGHCRESGVAGALRGEDALDHRYFAHLEPEIPDRQALECRRDRLCLRGARILVNPSEREVGRERSIVEAEAPASEAGMYTLAKLHHARCAGGHAEPYHARPSSLRKTAGAIEIQGEPRDGRRRLGRRFGDGRELFVRRPAQERKSHVQVFWFHPPQCREARRQDRAGAIRQLRGQRYGHEKAHAPEGTVGWLEGRGVDLVADKQRQESDRKDDRERPERCDARRLTAFDTGKCCDDQVCHRHVLQAFGVPNVAGGAR